MVAIADAISPPKQYEDAYVDAVDTPAGPEVLAVAGAWPREDVTDQVPSRRDGGVALKVDVHRAASRALPVLDQRTSSAAQARAVDAERLSAP